MVPASATPTGTPTASPSPATPSPTPTEADWVPEGDWKLVLDSDFDSGSLPKPWRHRQTDVYEAGGRWCSAPRKANVDLAGGSIELTMSRASKATTRSVSAEARRKQRRAGQEVVGCPEGVFDNAMVSTEGRFAIETGVVAARVKFPVEQGAHAGVWLQSPQGQELDMIETFGFGRGITNIVHVAGRKIPAEGRDGYVAVETVADPQWWARWHTVSLEWTRSRVIFRVDGEVTRNLAVKTRRADYFLVLSLLSSDWETYRANAPDSRPGSGVALEDVSAPDLPFSMQVDWVRAWEPA